MHFIFDAPLLCLFLFSLAPIIGGFIGWLIDQNRGNQLKAKGDVRGNEASLQAGKGIHIGLLIGFLIGILIDLPLFCFVLWGFSAM